MPEKNYDDFSMDSDDVISQDIDMSPQHYIHSAIIKAQNVLAQDEMKEGFTKYRVFIEHIESLCRASKMLPDEYEKKIKEFKNSDDYKKEESPQIKSTRLANHKLELILTEVFGNKAMKAPIKA